MLNLRIGSSESAGATESAEATESDVVSESEGTAESDRAAESAGATESDRAAESRIGGFNPLDVGAPESCSYLTGHPVCRADSNAQILRAFIKNCPLAVDNVNEIFIIRL
ncbi:hypothetical protein BSK53_29435 [Paenibacillus odorifer]|nr:hypothetical protein BSK53_29435 [Paenibacillus odorifer]